MQRRFDAGAIAAARDLPNGSRRIYVRIAKADHPYAYFNQDGTKRIEVIKTDDLFSPQSVATAQSMPILLGHPLFKLDSSNNQGHIHGALGERLVREDTTDGSFLGAISTLYTDEAKQKSEQAPGVSPGYGVRVERRDSDSYWQKDRVYDHLAIAVTPRGGNDVRAMFEGIRMDASDNSPLWIARYDEECYQCSADSEFIDRVLDYDGDRAELLQNTPIRLTEADLTPPVRHDDDGPCGCEKCSAKKSAKKSATRGKGFGPDDENLTKKKKRMDTTDFNLDGVTWGDIPSAFAQSVQVRLERADKAAVKAESMQARLADLEAENEALREMIAEMEEGRTDGEEGDRNDEADQAAFEEAAISIAMTIDRMRQDGQALVDAGKVAEFDSDPRYIVSNMSELQREMISFAAPSIAERLDSYNDDQVAAMYEGVMASIHSQVSSDRADSKGGSKLRALGSSLRHDAVKSKHWGDAKRAKYEEEAKAHAEAYNSVGRK